MKNTYILKKFSTFNVAINDDSVSFVGNVLKQKFNFPSDAQSVSCGVIFFKDRSRMFLFKSQVLSGIERSLQLYFKKLTLKGIGFKCYKLTEKLLLLKVGYTHKFYYHIPHGDVSFICKKGRILIYGSGVTSVSNVTYEIKNLRQPDSYKGKGIIFTDEKLKLKSSKKRI